MQTEKPNSTPISVRNTALATKSKSSQEPIEKHYHRAHRKAFLAFISHGQDLTALQIQRVMANYDVLIISHGKHSNIMDIYPHSMTTFVEHLCNGTLDELKYKSETIHQGTARVKLAADPTALKYNTKIIPTEPANRKTVYLAPGVSYKNK